MTVKIAVFKSGEQVICDIKEGFDQDKLITYLLENPCKIKINSRHKYSINNEDQKEQMHISLEPWPTFSGDSVVPIVTDFLVTAVEPAAGLKKMYEEQFKNETNQTDSIDEQSDSDQSG